MCAPQRHVGGAEVYLHLILTSAEEKNFCHFREPNPSPCSPEPSYCTQYNKNESQTEPTGTKIAIHKALFRAELKTFKFYENPLNRIVN